MGHPAFMTVEEAATVLRIGRTAAYELARRFRDTDGAEGIPVITVGRQLRVPRARLEAWAGGPLSDPNHSPTPPHPSARTLHAISTTTDLPLPPPA